MSEIHWIKLSTDMFDSRKIRQIESLPEGDGIIVIWVKILCLAGKINDCGMVYFTKDIPYTEQMLSQYFNRPLNLVTLALHTFESFHMIEIVDDFLKVSGWEEHQNIEGMEKVREQSRVRVARFRENKKKNLLPTVSGNATVTLRNGTDKNRLDKNRKEKNISSSSLSPSVPVTLPPIPTKPMMMTTTFNELQKEGIALYEKNIGPLTEIIADLISDDIDKYGIVEFRSAVVKACQNNVRKLSYIESILGNQEKKKTELAEKEIEKQEKSFKPECPKCHGTGFYLEGNTMIACDCNKKPTSRTEMGVGKEKK